MLAGTGTMRPVVAFCIFGVVLGFGYFWRKYSAAELDRLKTGDPYIAIIAI